MQVLTSRRYFRPKQKVGNWQTGKQAEGSRSAAGAKDSEMEALHPM
jgi:hypothetical protein